MAKYFSKALAGKEGTFINMSSTNAILTSPGQSAYCGNKAAGHRVTEQIHLGKPRHSFHLPAFPSEPLNVSSG